MSYEEKRRHKRFDANIEVPFWKYVRLKKNDEIYVGFVKNISRGGVFIETDIVFSKDTEVGFEFYLPISERAITGLATVMWMRSPQPGDDESTSGHGMGLQFKSFDGDGESVLHKFIEATPGKPA